ncbi:MAG TPA: DUF4349 domain-containing protein, partial [Isosphaeraceae bacterium]|nr:DUF4349 domain-containing protein [Isosphaeraceae bacterium]
MTIRRRHRIWIAAGLLLAPGCGAEDGAAPVGARKYQDTGAMATGELKQLGLANHAAASQTPAGGEKAAAKAPTPASQRKIIYYATIDLTVEDFARAERALTRLVREVDGYVANSNLQGSPGAQRSGTWEARIPAEKLDSFVEDVVRLGELQGQKLSSQDVSRQFFDTEARIKNKKYSGPRKLDHRLSYAGGRAKGERWQASGKSTRRRSRPRSPWPPSGGT